MGCNARGKVTVALATWVAPSSINSRNTTLQADFLAVVLKDGGDNIGTLIMPQWTYHKG